MFLFHPKQTILTKNTSQKDQPTSLNFMQHEPESSTESKGARKHDFIEEQEVFSFQIQHDKHKIQMKRN